jgi:predicted MFS family arabinose efflux permease
MAAPAIPGIAESLSVSLQQARVVQAVYLYGFALGAVILTPLSEDYGRRRALLPSVLLLALLQLPCALAPNYALLVTARLLAGFFASVTFTSVGVINDLFAAEQQGWGVNTFALR